MKIRKRWIILPVVVIAAAVFAWIYFGSLGSYRQKIESITLSGVDIGALPDGTYQGEYDADYIYAKVSVEIEDGKMAAIDLLEHKNERGAPAEKIIDDMIQEQKIGVDTVSGATNSSKVIQKAVDNALSGAKD